MEIIGVKLINIILLGAQIMNVSVGCFFFFLFLYSYSEFIIPINLIAS